MTREAEKDPHLGPPVFWTLICIFKMNVGPQDMRAVERDMPDCPFQD